MKLFLRLSTLQPLAFVVLNLLATTANGITDDEFDAVLKGALADSKIRGAAVAFRSPSQQTFARGYGKTAASDDSSDVTADTAFMLASVSKVFTGAAVAVLLDQGIIQSLDDNICDVMPDTYSDTACRNPSFPSVDVTWRMMATHRSSLMPDIDLVTDSMGQNVSASYGPTGGYTEEAPAAGNPTCPLLDVQGFYRDIMIDKESETMVGRDGLMVADTNAPLNWYDFADFDGGVWNMDESPGSYSDYSNFAMGYIAALVEHATGQSFEDFCKAHIFSKLGMSGTSWFRESLPQGTEVAVPVYALESGGYADVGHYCFIDYASGQLYSTANDMAKWAEAILTLGTPSLWSEATSKNVFGCQEKDANGNVLDDSSCSFALAWELLNNEKRDDMIADNFNHEEENWLEPFKDMDWTNGVMHSGYEEGCLTQLLVLPNAGVYSVVLINTSEYDDFAPQEVTLKMATALLANAGGTRNDKGDLLSGADTQTSSSSGIRINEIYSLAFYLFGVAVYLV